MRRRWRAVALGLLLTLSLPPVTSPAAELEPSTFGWGCAFGSASCRTTPTAVEGLSDVVAVAASASGSANGKFNSQHALALRIDGTVAAWGDNESGQLGDGTETSSPTPVQGKDPADPTGKLTGVVRVAAGGAHSLALKANGTVWAWGHNDFGQLGDGATLNRGQPAFNVFNTHSTTPVQVVDPDDASGYLTGVVAIAAGGIHSLAVKADGTAVAWGGNSHGQLGNGIPPNPPRDTPSVYVGGQSHPSPVMNLTGVRNIAGGASHSLAVRSDGTVFAWGSGGSGQLGDGSTVNRGIPVQVVDPNDPTGKLNDVMGVAGGGFHSLAVTSHGQVLGWGSDGQGRLGDGPAPATTTQSAVPVRTKGAKGAVAVAAGATHSMALTAQGEVLAWGGNGSGQLGDGSKTNKDVPAVVGGLSGADAVAVGPNSSIALLAAGPPPSAPTQPAGPRKGALDYDLAITMSDTPDPASAEAPVTYTLTVTNKSNTLDLAAGVTDILPPGVSFVSATSDHASCRRTSSGEVVCTSRPLTPGQGFNVEVVVIPTSAGNITNNASVYPAEPGLVQQGRDTNPDDNVASENTTVVGSGQPPNQDPDPLGVAVSIEDTSVGETDSGTTDATFSVSLSRPGTETMSVDYATADATATAPGDYQPAAANLTFSPGQITRTVVVKVNGDGLPEPDETFLVRLSNPRGGAAVADGEAVGTIVDQDDPKRAPLLSISDARAVEGDSGVVPATLEVSLSKPSEEPVTVRYETADRTARAPGDYTARSDTLTIPAGQTMGQVDVSVNADTEPEPDETFVVELFGATGADIADRMGTGTIVDDDDDGPARLSVGDISGKEGDAGINDEIKFTVSLSRASDESVYVDYDYVPGTASSGDDYSTAGCRPPLDLGTPKEGLKERSCGEVAFPPRATEVRVSARVVGDRVPESDEDFFLQLSSPRGAIIADGKAKATIVDDDTGPAVSINDVAVTQPSPGDSVDAVFTVSLSAPWGQRVTVDYATADHSAKAPGDYTAAQDTASFNPGETTRPATVSVKGDDDAAAESFFVRLSNPASAHLAKTEGYGDIIPAGKGGASGSGARHGKIFVTGRDSDGHTPPEQNNHTGAINVVRRAVAYVTPGNDAPRLLYTLHEGHNQIYLRNAGFAPCTAGPPATPGCFDVTDGDGDFPGAKDLRTVAFTEYDAVVVPSDPVQNLHSLQQGPSQKVRDILIGRKQELAAYLDGDGGVVAFNEESFYATQPYGFLPVALKVGEFTPRNRHEVGHRTTPAGRTMGLTDADINGNFYHNYFRESSGLDVMDVDDQGRIVTLGLPLVSADGTVSNATVTEGDGGPVDAVFKLSLSGASTGPVKVDYTTADREATAPGDYTAVSGSVVIDAGQLEKPVTVKVAGDVDTESTETFALTATFTDTVTGTTFVSEGVGTILDNDDPTDDTEVDDGDEGGRDKGRSEDPATEPLGSPANAASPSASPSPGVQAGADQAGGQPAGQAAAQVSGQPAGQSAGQAGGQSAGQGQAGQAGAQQAAQAAQGAAQPGLMMEAERRAEVQVETVEGAKEDPNTLLATARPPPAPPGAVVTVFGTALGLFSLTLASLSSRWRPSGRPVRTVVDIAGAEPLNRGPRQPRHRRDGGTRR